MIHTGITVGKNVSHQDTVSNPRGIQEKIQKFVLFVL